LLERLTRSFRLLLDAFTGAVCPLCTVRAMLEREEIKRTRTKAKMRSALCGKHFEAYLGEIDDLSLRARQIRGMLELLATGARECGVCARLNAAEVRLARSVRWLETRMRFRKALERAPLFCRQHERLVATDGAAQNFTEIQRVKLRSLSDAIARAALRGGDEVKPLLSFALAYLGQSDIRQSPAGDYCNAAESPDTDARIFEAWDSEQQLKRLGDVEAEVASLRYRNAVLFEENRRLKLAHTALQATCRDLENERAEFLATKNQRDGAKH
jgi:hypothetical protein